MQWGMVPERIYIYNTIYIYCISADPGLSKAGAAPGTCFSRLLPTLFGPPFGAILRLPGHPRYGTCFSSFANLFRPFGATKAAWPSPTLRYPKISFDFVGFPNCRLEALKSFSAGTLPSTLLNPGISFDSVGFRNCRLPAVKTPHAPP